MPRLVSRTDLATLAGVSQAAITQACRDRLAPACVGKRLNLDHSAVRQYLRAHGKAVSPPPKESPRAAEPKTRRVEQPARPPPRSGAKPPSGVRVVEVDNIGELGDWTIREAVSRIGSKTAFRDWVGILKTIEDAHAKRLANQQTERQLVLRAPIAQFVFGSIDAANRRLLNDTPQTIARRIYALARASAPVEEAEGVIRELIGSQLRVVKTQAAKILRDAHPAKTVGSDAGGRSSDFFDDEEDS